MSKIEILNEKLYSKRLPLNNGTEKTFDYKGWSGLKGVIADYVAEKAVAENRECDFTSGELLKAPWMVTQTALIMEADYSSIFELIEKAKYAYRRIVAEKSLTTV